MAQKIKSLIRKYSHLALNMTREWQKETSRAIHKQMRSIFATVIKKIQGAALNCLQVKVQTNSNAITVAQQLQHFLSRVQLNPIVNCDIRALISYTLTGMMAPERRMKQLRKERWNFHLITQNRIRNGFIHIQFRNGLNAIEMIYTISPHNSVPCVKFLLFIQHVKCYSDGL